MLNKLLKLNNNNFLNNQKSLAQLAKEIAEKAKKIADPDGTGKITFESFRTLSLAAIEEGKKRGKL